MYFTHFQFSFGVCFFPVDSWPNPGDVTTCRIFSAHLEGRKCFFTLTHHWFTSGFGACPAESKLFFKIRCYTPSSTPMQEKIYHRGGTGNSPECNVLAMFRVGATLT